jgi:hypothetical protein
MMDRRRLLTSLATATAFAGTAPALATAAMTELGQNTDRYCPDEAPDELKGSWSVARQDRQSPLAHAIDFWTKAQADINPADYLPGEILRGALWYNHGDSVAWMREAEALAYVDSAFKQDRSGWIDDPRQFIRLGDGEDLAPALRSLVGNRGRRTALIDLDSRSYSWNIDPEWGEIIPAFRACYDRIIGYFDIPRRGLRQDREWMGSGYYDRGFAKPASLCDAVVMTSSSLVETDARALANSWRTSQIALRVLIKSAGPYQSSPA